MCSRKWFFPTHGRIGTVPANNVSVVSNDQELIVSGEMRETALFGSNLVLKREIKSKVFSNELEINDVIINNGNNDEYVYYLYHINFGYPFLDENIKIISDTVSATPRDKEAEEQMHLLDGFQKPYDDAKEAVFFRKLKDENGISRISIVNDKLNIKATIEYENKYLPNLVQWSSTESNDYALGLEPTNTKVQGRLHELNDNKFVLKKNEKIEIKVKLIFEKM